MTYSFSFFLISSESELNLVPGCWMWLSWIEKNWILEFSVMIFGVDGSSSGISNNDELIDGLLVMEVLVEIILEVLYLIHVLLDKVISSDLLEWEGFVIKLPGVYTHWSGNWVFTLTLHFLVDVLGV